MAHTTLTSQPTNGPATMTYTDLPTALQSHLINLDTFISTTINPLQNKDDNIRFFDHRREASRTNWSNDGLPTHDWTALLSRARRAADEAGFLRFSLPRRFGGSQPDEREGRGANFEMSVIREHLAAKGLGLFNDLQTEHSIVGNFPVCVMVMGFERDEERKKGLIEGMLTGKVRATFGLTEPGHGSDATFMETRGTAEVRGGVKGWRINGAKMWQTGMDSATHIMLFTRTAGRDGDAKGVSCFVVPADAEGVKVESYEWTFNMPTDHATVSFTNVWVPESTLLGPLHGGLGVAQAFVHENRIRQAASSLGAAVFCINESVKYAMERKPFGKPLASNQGIQFPLVELNTQAHMLRLLIRDVARKMDEMPHIEVEKTLSDRVSMCNYWSNRLCCQAADRAMQVHGGWGYSRHKPFEHIYRHHRRYRITEGSEEIQMRKIAAYMFGFAGPNKVPKAKTDVETAKL